MFDCRYYDYNHKYYPGMIVRSIHGRKKSAAYGSRLLWSSGRFNYFPSKCSLELPDGICRMCITLKFAVLPYFNVCPEIAGMIVTSIDGRKSFWIIFHFFFGQELFWSHLGFTWRSFEPFRNPSYRLHISRRSRPPMAADFFGPPEGFNAFQSKCFL